VGWDLTSSSWAALKIGWNRACNCERVAPSFIRPRMRNQLQPRLVNEALLYIMAGIQMSTNLPGSTPKNPWRATPTIWAPPAAMNEFIEIWMRWPMMCGSPWKRRCQ